MLGTRHEWLCTCAGSPMVLVISMTSQDLSRLLSALFPETLQLHKVTQGQKHQTTLRSPKSLFSLKACPSVNLLFRMHGASHSAQQQSFLSPVESSASPRTTPLAPASAPLHCSALWPAELNLYIPRLVVISGFCPSHHTTSAVSELRDHRWMDTW